MSKLEWLTEMVMEDPIFIHQYEMSSIDDFIAQQQSPAAFGEDIQHSHSSDTFSYFQTFDRCNNIASMKPMTTDTWNSCASGPEASSSPKVPSYESLPQVCENSKSVSSINMEDKAVPTKNMSYVDQIYQTYASKDDQGDNRGSTLGTKSVCTRDHIIAERKRREKLNQRFKTLSEIVPGITKMDKASVLEYSVAYIKQLQEKIKILEDRIPKKTTQMVVSVNKLQTPSNCVSRSTEENFTIISDDPLPEIEARVSDKNILIRIHCRKRKGVFMEMLAETEKHNLTVINSSAIPFGTSTLDITIMAQMNQEFNLELNDLVRNLSAAFAQMYVNSCQ